MGFRSYFQDPPFRHAVVDRSSGRLTSPWVAWIDFAARALGRVSVVDVTADPPSLAAGARVSVAVPCPGAKAGDFALASFSAPHADVALSAHVSAAESVTVWFVNNGAGAVDLASGTLRVRVESVQR